MCLEARANRTSHHIEYVCEEREETRLNLKCLVQATGHEIGGINLEMVGKVHSGSKSEESKDWLLRLSNIKKLDITVFEIFFQDSAQTPKKLH